MLLRHGTAENPGIGRSDASRRLVPVGEQEAQAAGAALAALDLRPDVVLSSPKVRAWRTATLAAAALGIEPVEHAAIVGLDRDEALLLAELGRRVLVVGHEPDLSQVVEDLTGARIAMAKGGVAVIRLRGRAARLDALLGPDVLRRVS